MQSDELKKRILIMDDNAALAMEWRDVFELNQIDVEISHTAEEAVEYLDAESFDLVITDLFVKGSKGGLHVLAKLMKMGTEAPPAIAVTGSFVRADRNQSDENLFLRQARKLGSSATIQKPFPPIELVVLARKLWEQ